jgi:hypothetical protein
VVIPGRVSASSGDFGTNLFLILRLGQFLISQTLQQCGFICTTGGQYPRQAFGQFPQKVCIFVV